MSPPARAGSKGLRRGQGGAGQAGRDGELACLMRARWSEGRWDKDTREAEGNQFKRTDADGGGRQRQVRNLRAGGRDDVRERQ